MISGSPTDASRNRLIGGVILGLWLALLLRSDAAEATDDFLFKGKPVHPACVHALVTQLADDPLPISLTVSLAGCMASPRGAIAIQYEGQAMSIQDEALLGDENFAYRVLSQLTPELYILGTRMTSPDGSKRVSLAVVDLVERPMFRQGAIMQVPALQLLALVALPETDTMNFRRVGNVVQIKTGWGPNATERTVDLTPLVRASKKR